MIFNYANDLHAALISVPEKVLEKAYDFIKYSLYGPTVIFGNGGSAAIADHFCCDYNKGISTDTALRVKATSLCSNGPLITAIANDIGYEYIFEEQIKYVPVGKPMSAIAVSSSGNSPNIINGLIAAKKNNFKTMALVGFDGGKIKKHNLADIIVHVPSNNYGITEDAHMAILHAIIQKIRFEFAKDKTNLKL